MLNESAVIMLTSDHQLTVHTPGDLEFAARVITEQLGRIDAVFMAGDGRQDVTSHTFGRFWTSTAATIIRVC